jgi:glutamate N-acetyltransferase/amino-acid N-acetyltransferase
MKLDPGLPPPPVKGFRFAGVHGGLKNRGRRDFALIVADKPAVCAAAFTRNSAAAAPVRVARAHVARGEAQAIMINSGNANASTGDKGLKFAEWSCRELASRLSIDANLVLPCSTGVIGVQLDRTPFARAISLAVDGLSRKGFSAAARAIMTSDAFPKWAHRTVPLDGGEAVVAGMAKGAGMICPNMATMLAFVVTDAPLGAAAARAILADSVASTFNRISVDGDTSTNDTVILLASGQAAGSPIDGAAAHGFEAVGAAVRAVMNDLARFVVGDGEGAEHVVDVVVEGADSNDSADRIARAIVRSALVRCAITGADPNWGRIVCAIGNSGVDCDLEAIAIDVDDVALVRQGVVVSAEAARMARKVMRREVYPLRITVGRGNGKATVVTSDLTEAYVRFNSAYTS